MSHPNQQQSASTALTVASVVAEGGAMTVAQIKANRALMKQLMQEEMEEGVHYGTVPGTKKPSLLKPGAELLLALFRVDAVPAVEDLSTADCIRYRVTMKGVHMPTGTSVGHGVGEASTDEEKYKWRATYSDREWNATPEDRRRIKYGWDKGERREWEQTQIRTNPADAANTILKMASKRAKVDLALSVTAASDVFAQDLEDMAKWLRENESDDKAPPPGVAKAGTAAPRARAASSPTKLNAEQVAHLKREIDRAGLSEQAFCTRYSIDNVEDLPFASLNGALAYVKNINAGPGE